MDDRLTAARPDLAAQHLECKVKAARYAAGEQFEIADPVAPLRREPTPDAELGSQALHG
ncbi:MAG: hypothetical protein QOI46_3124, partial [Alphaproteobacteria bacterium]|nr:hypothetical protein [Alphaproteobacteria bacterium]